MSCMDCNSPVDSFHFALGEPNVTSSDVLSKAAAIFGGLSRVSPHPNLLEKSTLSHGTQRDGIAFLRIDNVPWV